MIVISEKEFRARLYELLRDDSFKEFGCVTGPGRSGAIAAVYASHFLSIPFIPFNSNSPVTLGRLLIVDTAMKTGRTLRKAGSKYSECDPHIVSVYHEPPRVIFWYEDFERIKKEMNDEQKIQKDIDLTLPELDVNFSDSGC